jgi:hypothetical protein
MYKCLTLLPALLMMGCGRPDLYCPELCQRGMESRPVISVYTDSSSPQSSEPGVILAVWQEGRVLWSKNSHNGGPPYYEGQIPAGKVRQVLEELARRGYLDNPILNNPSHVVLDGGYTGIFVRYGQRRLGMESSHELYEQDPRLVATDTGIESLEGRSRENVLAQTPRSYRKFRAAWQDVRNILQRAIPLRGVACPDRHFDLQYRLPPRETGIGERGK